MPIRRVPIFEKSTTRKSLFDKVSGYCDWFVGELVALPIFLLLLFFFFCIYPFTKREDVLGYEPEGKETE